MKTTFVNSDTMMTITRKTDKMAARWNYPKEQYWQLWQMVATVEIGMGTVTRFDDEGIAVWGWNDGGYYNPDPNQAWGGFYRLEKNQMAGWTLHLVNQAEDKEKEMERVSRIYGFYNLIWEDEPHVWGYIGQQSFYNEWEADLALATEKEDLANRFKRGEVRYSEMSGMWTVIIEATKRPAFKDVYRARIKV